VKEGWALGRGLEEGGQGRGTGRRRAGQGMGGRGVR